jgi:hypothetical protein
MPFPDRSMEQLYSDIATKGHEEGFIVVPEFKLHYVNLAGQRHAKKRAFTGTCRMGRYRSPTA